MTDNNSEDKLEKKFKKYCEAIKKIENISNEDKLYLYSNYKQSLFGDNNNEKPSIFNRVEMEKWKAWYSLLGQSKEESMTNYINKVKILYKNFNF
jgi:acyl-CoA-binding protein